MSKTSDNVNLDFPARMADGRIFTDYRQNCIMNSVLSQGKNSFEYRYFLIRPLKITILLFSLDLSSETRL